MTNVHVRRSRQTGLYNPERYLQNKEKQKENKRKMQETKERRETKIKPGNAARNPICEICISKRMVVCLLIIYGCSSWSLAYFGKLYKSKESEENRDCSSTVEKDIYKTFWAVWRIIKHVSQNIIWNRSGYKYILVSTKLKINKNSILHYFWIQNNILSLNVPERHMIDDALRFGDKNYYSTYLKKKHDFG